MALRTLVETLFAGTRPRTLENVQPGTGPLAVSSNVGQKVRGPGWVPALAPDEGTQGQRQLIAGVLGVGGGATVGLLAGPKLGMGKGLGALVGGGAGLLAALLVVRWT